ncbi:MAG: hypothetical protein J3T61_00205 [Candidatus Brocadiales bacterium]|nr:hypothetical protein [Candidatus Bathyanammoxibius sp.]
MTTQEAIRALQGMMRQHQAFSDLQNVLAVAARAEKSTASLNKQAAPIKAEIARLQAEHNELADSLPIAVADAKAEVAKIRAAGAVRAEKRDQDHKEIVRAYGEEEARLKASVAAARKAHDETNKILKDETEALTERRDKAQRAWDATKKRVAALVA